MAWLPLHRFAGVLSAEGTAQLTGLCQCLALNDRVTAANLVNAIGGGTLRAWVYQPLRWPPSWAVWASGSDFYLVFMGIVNAEQWAQALLGVYGVPWLNQPGITAHALFFNAWYSGLGADVLDAMGSLAGQTVNIYGHSFGGAVGWFCATDPRVYGPAAAVNLVTTGQPRAITSGFVGHLPANYDRVWEGGDPVPLLPPQGGQSYLFPVATVLTPNINWQHYGQGWRLTPSTVALDANLVTTADTAIMALAAGNQARHDLAVYQADLQAWSQRALEPAAPRAAIAAALVGLPHVASPAQQNVVFRASNEVTVAQVNSTYFGGAAVATQPNLDTGFLPLAASASGTQIPDSQFTQGDNAVAIFRTKLTFEYAGQSWTEQYWVDAAGPASAVAFLPSEITKLLGPRPAGTIFVSAAAYAPFATAAGALQTYAVKKPGTPIAPTTTADPTGVVAYCRMTTASGKSRQISLKCWQDGSVERAPDGGSVFSGTVVALLNDYANVLKTAPSWGIAYQDSKNTLIGKRYRVLSIAQEAPGVAALTLSAADYASWFTNDPLRVITFTGRDHVTLVALKGFFPVVSTTSPVILIAYQLPGGASQFTPSKLALHSVSYQFSPFTGPLTPVQWRTRKVGKGILVTRGRGSKQLSRT